MVISWWSPSAVDLQPKEGDLPVDLAVKFWGSPFLKGRPLELLVVIVD